MLLLFSTEIWQQVFSHFDCEGLEEFLAVSNDFRELIIKTPRLMKNLRVLFYHGSGQDEIPFLVKFGQHVKSVEFDYCCIYNKSVLCVPNIESFTFQIGSTMNDDSKNCLELDVKLPQLTHVKIFGDKNIDLILDVLRDCVSLETCKIALGQKKHFKCIEDFLSRQNNLKELKLTKFSSFKKSGFLKKFHESGKSKLKKLQIDLAYLNHRNVLEFFSSQASSIEELSMSNLQIDICCLVEIFQSFHNLKKLCSPSQLKLDKRTMKKLENLQLLKVRELEIKFEDLPIFAAIVKLCPNVEVLITDNRRNQLRGNLEKLPQLKKIILWGVDFGFKSFSITELQVNVTCTYDEL